MLITGAVSAREFGNTLAHFIEKNDAIQAYQYLTHVLAERTPFRLLDLIGESIASCSPDQLNPFLEAIASQKTEGGWVVIASALKQGFSGNLDFILQTSRRYIIQADIWYACDIFGERVIGAAILEYFEGTLRHLESWRIDKNRWVRRSLGIAGHYWAKRTKDNPKRMEQAKMLLGFYQPMLGEKNIDAAKGIGWALKTFGRYNPEIVLEFLRSQIAQNTSISTIIRRKALKFIPLEMKARLLE